MKKISITQASCVVEMDWYLRGSLRRGDVDAGCTAVRSHLDVQSDADPEVIREVLRVAKKGCFAEQMIQRPVPMESTITLNGERVAFDSHASGDG